MKEGMSQGGFRLPCDAFLVLGFWFFLGVGAKGVATHENIWEPFVPLDADFGARFESVKNSKNSLRSGDLRLQSLQGGDEQFKILRRWWR